MFEPGCLCACVVRDYLRVQLVFNASVASIVLYVVLPFLKRADQYIKRMRKTILLFPPEVICGVDTFRKAVFACIENGGHP